LDHTLSVGRRPAQCRTLRCVSDDKAKHPVDDTDHLLAAVFERFAMTGEWPLVGQLRHELDKANDDIDVMAVGRELGPNLGTVGLSHGDRASLTIHGIARCPGSGEVLEDLLRTMRLAYERFRADGTGAAITSDDLRNDLGFSALRVRRTFELMWTLPGIGGGTGASEGSWRREITADITAFRRAHTVQDVIAAAPSRRRPLQPEISPPSSPSASIRSQASTIALDSLVDLHPQVVAAAGALFRDGHYAQASFQAFKALEVALR
jgi:hypothetical protein